MTDDTTTAVQPISHVTAPNEQHMLFLFLPLKQLPIPPPSFQKGNEPPLQSDAFSGLSALLSGQQANQSDSSQDPRSLTGVHFYMAYTLKAGEAPNPPQNPPFTAFQVPPPYTDNKGNVIHRDLAVVMSIYDADFAPYIGAFTDNKDFATYALDPILHSLDETGLVDPNDPTTALNIIANGGTYANPDAFVALLMRYNWADPTIPGATSPGNIASPNPGWKYFLGATFPGMTIGNILDPTQGYANANQLYPFPGGKIDFDPSTPPD